MYCREVGSDEMNLLETALDKVRINPRVWYETRTCIEAIYRLYIGNG